MIQTMNLKYCNPVEKIYKAKTGAIDHPTWEGVQ